MSAASTDLGRDTSCTTSMRTGRFATKAQLVAEAAYRRLTTPRGMLRGGEEEANYGYDLTELCGSSNVKAATSSAPGRIRSELLKDERITSVDVDVLTSKDGPETTFQIAISAKTSEGPFTLKLLASAVTVELLGIITEATQ